MTPGRAVQIVLKSQLMDDVQVVSVKRMTWWQFAHARCSGVAYHRVVYVVRLRFPSGLPFRYGFYDPGTLTDSVVDAETGVRFTGHVMGSAPCWHDGPHRAERSMSPGLAARCAQQEETARKHLRR